MVTLPDKNALGRRLPGASIGVPQFSNPGAVGQALGRLGGAAANASADFGEAERLRDEGLSDAEKFGVNTRFLEFEQQWRDHYRQRTDSANPGAVGFREGLTEDYRTRAREFLRTVPEAMKPEMDQRLYRLENSIANKASDFQDAELNRYSLTKVDDGLNALLSRQAEEPDAWREIEAEGVQLIRSAPGLSPIEKDEAVRAWREQRASFDATTQFSLGDYRRVATDLGASPDYLAKLENVESGGNANARAGTSSATGLHQFTDATWLAVARRNEPSMLEGRSNAEVLALRSDPDTSRRMAAYLTAENRNALNRAGLPITDGTLYLAHFAGSQGAIDLMRAGPDTPVEQVLSADAIEANSFLRGKTAHDVVSWAERKMGGAALGGVADRYAHLSPSERVKLLGQAQREMEVERRREVSDYVDGFDNFIGAVSSGATVSDAIAARYTDAGIASMRLDAQQAEMMRQVRDDALLNATLSRQILGATPEGLDNILKQADQWTEGEVTTDTGMALAPNRAKMQAATRKAVMDDMKARQDDPARYAIRADGYVGSLSENLNQSPELARRYAEATLGAQEHMGIPGHARRVLTVPLAQETVASIHRLEPADRGQQLDAMSRQWGEHWPKVLDQLREAELHPALYFAAEVADDPGLSQRIAGLADVDATELAKGIEQTEARDIRTRVRDGLAVYAEAVMAGDTTGRAAGQVNDLLGVAEGLALQEYRRTGNMRAAVDIATERFVNSRYPVIEGRNMLAYVPADRNLDAIEAGAERVLDTLPGIAPFGGDEDAPGFLRDERIRRAAQSGVWVTNSTRDGLALMVDVDGTPLTLMGDDGEPYGFTFDELEKLGAGGEFGAASAAMVTPPVQPSVEEPEAPSQLQIPTEGLLVSP